MLYDVTVPVFKKSLGNLNRILDKGAQHAAAKKFDVSVLLNARLAPDMFNLIKQVQIACGHATSTARLTGKEPPAAENTEKTLEEVKKRINDTISYLDTLAAKDFDGERRVSLPRWEGKSLSAKEYALQYLVPNFYFHVTTAYDILRHNGVDIGKKDFIGELPYK